MVPAGISVVPPPHFFFFPSSSQKLFSALDPLWQVMSNEPGLWKSKCESAQIWREVGKNQNLNPCTVFAMPKSPLLGLWQVEAPKEVSGPCCCQVCVPSLDAARICFCYRKALDKWFTLCLKLTWVRRNCFVLCGRIPPNECILPNGPFPWLCTIGQMLILPMRGHP